MDSTADIDMNLVALLCLSLMGLVVVAVVVTIIAVVRALITGPPRRGSGRSTGRPSSDTDFLTTAAFLGLDRHHGGSHHTGHSHDGGSSHHDGAGHSSHDGGGFSGF